jgi:hypothetical protein
MEEAGPKITTSSTTFFVVVAVLLAAIAGLIAYVVLSKRNTTPSGGHQEGFQGPAKGVSDIPCGQESSDAIAVLEIFSNKKSSTGEGSADLSELKQILSKLCCLKHDLMGPSQVVQSMLYVPYNNTHDRENPADTAARCFTKSIPPRDLDITFGTWKKRALTLINRLCTSYKLSDREAEKAMKHFTTLWLDVFAIAKNACVPSSQDGSSFVSPRDVKGFTPETVEELGAYTGYY